MSKKLIIFYSGEGSKANPEIVLGRDANIMLTFWDVYDRSKGLPKRHKKVFTQRYKESKKRDDDSE